MPKKELLKTIGIIMILVGAVILFNAFPLVQQSVISFGLLKITDIPAISATRIAIGSIGIILGLIIYFGKEGLKVLGGK